LKKIKTKKNKYQKERNENVTGKENEYFECTKYFVLYVFDQEQNPTVSTV